MKISIALATYNGEKYIQEQLDSFLFQTRLPDELVVCDDCSSDRTLEIIEKFKIKAPFEVNIYKNNENIGYEKNFEKVISLSGGDIILLSDQDDYWLTNKLSVIESIFLTRPYILVVINDMCITDSNLKSTGITVVKNLKSMGILGKNNEGFIIGCGTAISRRILKLILPFPPLNFGHDRWIHAVAESLNSRFILIDSLQLHRRHESNASTFLFDQTNNPSWRDMVQTSANLNMPSIYANQRDVKLAILNRIRCLNSETFNELKCLISLSKIDKNLRNSQQAYENRILLLNSNGFFRKFLAIQMFLKGDYNFFLGWRSFLKDLIR